MGADVELSSVARLRVFGADFARQVDIIRRFAVDISDSVVDYQFVMRRKHLRIWQLPTFFGRGQARRCRRMESLRIAKRGCTTGIAGCVDSADADGYDAICRLGALSASASSRARRTVDGRLRVRGYVGGGQSASAGRLADGRIYGVGSSDSDGRMYGVGASDSDAGGCLTPTGSVDTVICVAGGLVCGVVRPSASPPTGGRGGLRENCRTLVYYAFWRAKFFYKRRVRRVKEMLRIWVFLKEKYPPQSNAPPPADARKRAQEAA